MDFNLTYLVGAVIVACVLFGIVKQALETRRSKTALASREATAVVTCESGLAITEVDGRPLYVPEIALVPGVHTLVLQVSKLGGFVNLPAVRVVVEPGQNRIEWSGTQASDITAWIGSTQLIRNGAAVLAESSTQERAMATLDSHAARTANMLLKDVHWALGQKKYARYEDFIAAVTQYNDRIAPAQHGWDPTQQISPNPITVLYEAAWKDEDDMLEIEIGEPGHPLSMGAFLFALNNESYAFFQDADAHFFEGLTSQGGATYQLDVGS